MSTSSDPIVELRDMLYSYYDLVTSRLSHVFSDLFNMSQWRWIRLGLIVVAYIVLRPLIVRFSEYIGEKETAHRERKANEKKDRERRERKAKARVGANDLRGGGGGGRVIGEVISDEEGEEVLVSVDGKGKGKGGGAPRQRRAQYKTSKADGPGKDIQKILDEMESDSDVEDLITGISREE